MDMGKNHVDGGRQGGTINTLWDGEKMNPKLQYVMVQDSFFISIGCMLSSSLWVHYGMEEQNHPALGRNGLYLVLHRYIIVFFGWRFQHTSNSTLF